MEPVKTDSQKLGFKSGPVTFCYRSNKGPVYVTGVYHVSGEVPAYNKTSYVIFYDENHKRIGRCAESRLLGDGKKKFRELFGRSYWNRIYRPGVIELEPYRNWEVEFGCLPEDTECVWAIVNKQDGVFDQAMEYNWVIEHKRGATLHIFNNEEVTREAPSFEEVLRLLFPDHKIRIYTPKTTYEMKEVG